MPSFILYYLVTARRIRCIKPTAFGVSSSVHRNLECSTTFNELVFSRIFCSAVLTCIVCTHHPINDSFKAFARHISLTHRSFGLGEVAQSKETPSVACTPNRPSWFGPRSDYRSPPSLECYETSLGRTRQFFNGRSPQVVV